MTKLLRTTIAQPHLGDGYTILSVNGGPVMFTNSRDILGVASVSFLNNLPVSYEEGCVFIYNATAGVFEQSCDMARWIQID